MNNEGGKTSFVLGLDNSQLQRDAKQAMQIFNGIGDRAEAEGARIDTAFNRIRNAVVGVFTIQQASNFVREIVNVRGEIESVQKSFEVLAGKSKGNVLFSDIKDFALNTTMSMGTLAKGAQTMMGFNIAAEEVMPILRAMGDISMGNADKFQSLILAFSQMRSTGKLMGQDLLQMINAGFNPLSVISEQTGKSIGTLKEEMAAGSISAEMVTKAFMDAASAGGKFYNMLETQSDGVKGSIAELKGVIENTLNDIGSSNQGIITGSIQGATEVVKHYKEIGEALAVIISMYGAYRAAIIAIEAFNGAKTAVMHTEEAAALYKLLTAEQQAAISKKGLSVASAKYIALVKAESAANVQAAKDTLVKARVEVSEASKIVAARRAEYLAAKDMEKQRLAELMSIGAKGTAKQVEVATTRLATAEKNREAAATAFLNAQQDFHAKRTAVATAAKTAETVATTANTASQTANATATGFLTVAKTRLIAVAAKLNAVIMANPWALVAAAVIAVGYAIYKLATYQTDAEKAQARLNETTDNFNKEVASERVQIDSLFARLKSAKEGTDEYKNAKQAIINQYGNYLDGLSSEIQSLKDIEGAYKAVTAAAMDAAKARAMEAATKEAADAYAEEEADAKDDLYKALKDKYGNKTDNSGMLLSEKYYWELLGTINNPNKKIKDEFLRQFDETHYVPGDPMTGIGSYTYTTNDISDVFNRIARAKGVYNNEVKEAQRRFGDIPTGNETPEEVKEIIKNKKYWEDYKKEQQGLLDAMSEAELETDRAAEIRKNIRDAQTKIDAYSVQKTDRKNDKEEEDEVKLGRKAEEYVSLLGRQTTEAARAAKDMEFAVEQARIDAMEEGEEKVLAQMALDHERELEELDREKADYLQRKIDNAKAAFEANPANKDKVFDGSGISLTPEEEASFASRRANIEKKHGNEEQKYIEAQRRAMNEYLKEYGTYLEKRNAIIALYDEQIANATSEGQKLTLAAQMREELSELDIEANKSTASISKLFEDMTNKTVKDMRLIADNAEAALQFLIDGEWDEQKGLEFGMTKETFDTLRKSPEELEKIRKGIRDCREEADQAEGAFKKMGNGLKNLFAAGNDSGKLKKALGEIEEGFGEIMQLGSFLSDTFSNLGDTFGSDTLKGIGEGINVAMDAASSAMSGAQAGAMFGPWGAAAGAAIGLVSSLGSSLAKLHDAKHEKKIQKIQEQIEVLEKSYEKLGRSIEDSFSKDAQKLINQQNTLLEQQKVLIRQQIQEEKDKKDTDWDRIKDWENQIEDIDQLIADNKEKAVDAIFGEDLKSAIENFSESYADAWATGGNKAKSAKEVVKNMMRQMVTESIKAAIKSSNKMEEIRAKLQQFYADNVLSSWEQDYIYRMAEQLQEQLDDQFGWADDLMTDEDAEREGVKKGIATASQESVDENNARVTTIQGHTYILAQNSTEMRKEAAASRSCLQEIRDLSYEALDHLETISKNTAEMYETNRRLKRIEESLDDINTRGVTIK